MIAEFTGLFRPFAWMSVPFVALALYVGTWPIVEMKTSKKVNTGWLTRHTAPATATEYAPWTRTLYKPIHVLCDKQAEGGVLVQYWNSWSRTLKHDAVPPWKVGKL